MLCTSGGCYDTSGGLPVLCTSGGCCAVRARACCWYLCKVRCKVLLEPRNAKKCGYAVIVGSRHGLCSRPGTARPAPRVVLVLGDFRPLELAATASTFGSMVTAADTTRSPTPRAPRASALTCECCPSPYVGGTARGATAATCPGARAAGCGEGDSTSGRSGDYGTAVARVAVREVSFTSNRVRVNPLKHFGGTRLLRAWAAF